MKSAPYYRLIFLFAGHSENRFRRKSANLASSYLLGFAKADFDGNSSAKHFFDDFW